MRETDVEVIHFPLRICNSIPSLPESMAGPEDLSLPLARGDGISRADSLQLGPAWHWEGAPAPTPRGCCQVSHGLLLGSSVHGPWPTSRLLLCRSPCFPASRGWWPATVLRIREDGQAPCCCPPAPFPSGAWEALPSPRPCQLLVTLCGPVTPF